MADRRPCPWGLDDAGMAALEEVAADPDCEAPAGWRGFRVSSGVLDKHGHELDGDFDPRGAGGCDHRDTAEWQAEHRGPKVENRMEPRTEETSTPAVPSVPAVTATVGVPDMPFNAAQYLPAGNQSGTVGVVMAVIAVVGGGAAWKFWNSLSQQKHEQKMKELEIRAEGQKQNDDQGKKCEGRHAAIEARLSALESVVSSSSSRTFDLETRATRLEEAAKAAPVSVVDTDELDENFAALSKRITKLETAAKKKGTK